MPAAERFPGSDGVPHQGIDKRVLPERVRSRVAGEPAYQDGKILVVNFGLCQLLDRLGELLASGWAVTTREARSRSGMAGASRMP